AVSTFDRWTERQKQEWRKRGYLSLVDPKLKPTFRMGVEFLDDLDKNGRKLDIEKAVSELDVPLLLVYGKQDLVTPVAEAEKLYAKSDRTKTELVIVENTGHMLGGVTSPFRGSSVLDHIIDLTLSWLGRNLVPGRKPDADT
ncbi:MAG TPA: alpha/beta hydrolase, partial [Bacteroidota bacterium]